MSNWVINELDATIEYLDFWMLVHGTDLEKVPKDHNDAAHKLTSGVQRWAPKGPYDRTIDDLHRRVRTNIKQEILLVYRMHQKPTLGTIARLVRLNVAGTAAELRRKRK